MNVREALEVQLAEKRAAEGKTDPPKSRPKPVERSSDDPDLFALARSVDTILILDRLGIAHGDKFAVCLGCGEDGALICKNGGLACKHDRCSHVGPPKNPGFRSTVDLVMEAERVKDFEAARKICEWGGIEIPKPKKKTNGTKDEEWSADDYPEADGKSSGDPPSPPQSSALESRWIDLGNALEWVTEPPPPQTWLLKRWHDMHDHGVLPRGKTGMVNATGGIGKTYAVSQMAVSVASGKFWLGTFRAVEPGHVLLALGEEDADEARRRINRAVNEAGLTDDERRAMAAHLHVLPLHGAPVALTCSPAHGVIVASDFAHALRTKLDGFGVDWALLILDPLSRWGEGGVEANNEVATRFVQVVETLTTVRGNPSVIVAHHSSQVSTRAGESDARGVTAIRDGFRWQVTLDGVEDDDANVQGVLLRNRKSNYSLRFKPLLLVRNTEPGIEGTLRLATDVEADELKALLPRDRQSAETREQAKQSRDKDRRDARRALVLEVLPEEPGHMNREALSDALQARGQSWSFDTLRAVVEGLIRDKLAVDLSDGARSKPRQWARKRDS